MKVHRKVKRAVFIVLGIDTNDKKDVLGRYVRENESTKFWLSIMNRLKNQGIEDILISCVDRPSGFSQAIKGCLSADVNPAVHHPPVQKFHKIYIIQGH